MTDFDRSLILREVEKRIKEQNDGMINSPDDF